VATTLRYILLGDDRASAAVDRYARSVDKANAATARQQAALKRQTAEQDKAGKSLGGLTAHVTGFQDAINVCSPKTSTFAKALAALNVAMGVGEPAAAGLIVAVGGLAAAYSSAAAGAVAYGVALKPLLTQTSAVMDAQKKLKTAQQQAQIVYANAIKSGTSAAAAAQARTLTLTKAQQQYNLAVKEAPAPVRALARELKGVSDFYTKWADRLARPVLAPLQHALTLVRPALQAISPLVRVTAGAIGELVDQLGRSVKGGGLERLVSDVLPHVRPAILDLGHSIANISVGVGGILKAFLPVADKIGGGVVHLTALFRQWATSLPQHTGFQSLMAMFRQETPLVIPVLKNLAEIIKNVASATVGLASPANSKALLQILTPLSQVMVQLSANQGLVRAVLYFGLLRGTLTRLGGAFGQVRSGLGFITSLASGAKKAHGAIGRFADGLESAAAASSAFSGKAGTLGGMLAKLAGGSSATIASLVRMVPLFGAGALAVGGLVAVMVHFSSGIKDVTDGLAKQDKATGFNIEGYRKLAAQTDANQYSQSKLGAAIRSDVPAFRAVREGAVAYSQTLGTVNQVHNQAASAAVNLSSRMGTLRAAYGLTEHQAELLAGKAGVTADALAATGPAGDAAFRAVVKYADGTGKAWVQSQKLTAAQDALNTALGRVQNTLLNQQASMITWRQAQQQATQAINESTTGLKGQSAAALNAKSAVVQSTRAALDLAQAQSQQRGGMAKATDTIREQIRFLQEHAGKSEFAKREVQALRDALRELRSKHINLTVTGTGSFNVTTPGTSQLGGIRRIGQQAGGPIRGPGGPTEDKAGLYALSNREWVIRAASASQYGDAAMSAVNRGTATILHRGNGMAAGGVVGDYADGPRGLGRFDRREYNATILALEKATAKAGAKLLRAGGVWGQGSGAKLVNLLRPYVGKVPYVWGGTSPSGWDCSGMTQWGLLHANGIRAPRTSEAQFAWARRSNDQVGALAFFVSPAGGAPPGHVGVSMGNGLMINAAGTLSGTTISGTGGNMGFGVPPGFAAGGKVGKHEPDPQRQKWLAMLARDVKLLEADQKRAAKRRTGLRHSVEIEELWFLTHPHVKRGSIAWKEQERALRNARMRLRDFNRHEAARERILTRKIALLRDLTGYPRGAKYGGPGAPAPPGLDGGDGGAGPGGPAGPPPIPPPMPAWMVAAGLGAPAAAGPAAVTVSRYTGPDTAGGFAAPAAEPLAGRIPAGRAAGGMGGFGGFAELAVALRLMTREMTGAVNRVAPGVAVGVDRSLNSMSARVAGKVPP
jgi:hypothetical protein